MRMLRRWRQGRKGRVTGLMMSCTVRIVSLNDKLYLVSPFYLDAKCRIKMSLSKIAQKRAFGGKVVMDTAT